MHVNEMGRPRVEYSILQREGGWCCCVQHCCRSQRSGLRRSKMVSVIVESIMTPRYHYHPFAALVVWDSHFAGCLVCNYRTIYSWIAVPRFGEFCSWSFLPLLPGHACNIHSTWEGQFSWPLYLSRQFTMQFPHWFFARQCKNVVIQTEDFA